jgi:hypothetical protein
LLQVIGQERVDVVAAVAERHLGQVVGAEAEEVGVLGDLVGGQRRTRDFDHRTDQEIQLAVELLGLLDVFDRLFTFPAAASVRRRCRPAGS